MSTEPFKREYGFITATTGAEISNLGNIRKGDQAWHFGWDSPHPCDEQWPWHSNGAPVRRKISPGPNFEILPLDGVPVEGCEYTSNGTDWYEFYPGSYQRTVSKWLELNHKFAAIRRPIKPVEQGGWVGVSDWLPEDGRLVIVAGGVARWRGGKWISETMGDSGRPIQWQVTHWMEIPKPPPPQPPRPAAEVAFEEWTKTVGSGAAKDSYTAWNAAIEFAKSNKGEL